MMDAKKLKDVLRMLEIGNSVAEFDNALDDYFVETEAFRSLISDRGDIIAGDKGTGKTALYRILKSRYASLPELNEVEVISGFNPEGSPIFERLASGSKLDEGQYATVWKAYILSLVGNWILEIYDGALNGTLTELDNMLNRLGLRTTDDQPTTVFNRLVNLYQRVTSPRDAELSVTLTPDGFPLIGGRVGFNESADETDSNKLIPHRDALILLDRALGETHFCAWVVMDRLDEAFQAYPAVEIPALRALLRTYLDLAEFKNLQLKLFLRKDLFRRIIAGGFVNLTHVNARRIEIVWDDDDLFDLLSTRIAENARFLESIDLAGERDPRTLFAAVFPDQVDAGKRRPKTLAWIMSRIRDGNGVCAPRNLIDLVQKAIEAQLRREEREANDYISERPLISSDAIKRGLAALSEARVEDTLLAEAGGNLASYIERFRDGKAEHNERSLATMLGLETKQISEVLKALLQVGFLEEIGSTYKVPMLYRDGLSITQGKAFTVNIP